MGNLYKSRGRSKKKAWRSLNSTTPQTMKYPLSAMPLNKKECKHIMQPIVKFGLTKVGISSTLHTAVRYVPHSLGGIGLFDLFVIQGTGRIAFLIKNYWKSTPSSPIFRDNLATLQLEAGRRRRISENYCI